MSPPPKKLADWIRYLHNAAEVPQGSPHYADAQEAVQFALGRIRNLGTAANVAAAEIDFKKQPPAWLAATGGVLHGASLGVGEPLSGVASWLEGKGFREGAQQYRDAWSRLQETSPNAAFGGELAGIVGQSAVPVAQGVKGGKALAQVVTNRGPNLVSRFLQGALHSNIAPGLALGGIAGFSQGGEDPGDIGARLESGAAGAALGALTQGLFGGLGALRVPRYRLRAIEQNVTGALGKKAPAATVAEVTAAAQRAYLEKEHYPPEVIDRLLAQGKAGANPTTVAPPPPPPTIRPGETIQPTPNLEKATFLRRGGTVRQDTSPISGNRSMSFDPGKGQTLPWYPRGGAVEQGVAPLPTTTVPTQTQLGQNQMAVFLDYLKQATTPQEALARLGTLRDLGIPTPGDPAQVLSLLFGAPR